MLYLYTGTPGAGKTLSAIDYIVQQQKLDPNRIIYAANIRGMKIPGVLELSADDVHKWHEICAIGSLIVVDEAQRYWRAARSGEPERAIVEMETHRHDGIDIVMITQHPGLIHANIRKLINRHVHLVAYTDHSALRWEAREVREDVQDASFRQNAEFQEWKYPQELYDLYDSAEKHTKVIKLSFRERWMRHGKKIAIGMFVAAAIIIGGYFMRVKDGTLMGVGEQVAPNPSAIKADSRPEKAVKWRNTAEYVEAQMPRVPSQPWSAPLYDNQQVTAHPQVYCVAKGDDSDCHCITEQGTRYTMALDICLNVAKNGPAYDPFRQERMADDRARTDGERHNQSKDKPLYSDVRPVSSALVPPGVPEPIGAAPASVPGLEP